MYPFPFTDTRYDTLPLRLPITLYKPLYFLHHRLYVLMGRIHRQMTIFISLFPLLEKFRDIGYPLVNVRAQKRPLAALSDPFRYNGGLGSKANNRSKRLKPHSVLGVNNSPAADRKYYPCHGFPDFFYDLFFKASEVRLSLAGEYVFYRHGGLVLDKFVRVKEPQTRELRERPSDRCLACAHETGKNYVFGLCHAPATPRPPSEKGERR